ncbi:MAG: RsmD family RNA methyltransferase [Alistipes sp.]|nr:RsmD family RNA methyltransferase [Alistipes sp.]
MSDIYNIAILSSEDVRSAVEQNIERDASAIALDKRVPHASAVATQVKYLQRARRKLPRMYESRCILPPRAFEQSSSEESAERKPISGGSVLDLTCGLGVDTMALARRFERVVSLERDEALADVVRYNMGLMGITNVTVVSSSAEEYLEHCTEKFDWVFVDPDRRSAEGSKMVCMEDCSPNILALMPLIKAIAPRIAIKLSPMFDCTEAFRLLSPAEVEVVSIAGECKELNIYTGAERDVLRVAVVGSGEWCFECDAMQAIPNGGSVEEGEWRYLHLPDVALQKARVAIAQLAPYASIWSNNGFALSREPLPYELGCRSYEIEAIEEYRPKELKRRYKGKGIDIIKRDTSLSVDAVRKALGARAGSEELMAITTINGANYVITLKNK